MCILLFDWLIALYLSTPLHRNASFIIVKHSCVREELSGVVFFFWRKFNKSLCKDIILVSSHSRPLTLVCAPPQRKLSPSPTTCAVDNFQRLRFGNSLSPDKFTGNSRIVSHTTSSQESLKHESMFTFTLRTIYPSTRAMACRIVAA